MGIKREASNRKKQVLLAQLRSSPCPNTRYYDRELRELGKEQMSDAMSVGKKREKTIGWNA